MTLAASAEAPFRVSCADGWLVARFARPQIMLSWAIVRGGRVSSALVAWRQVRDDELTPGLDPRRFLARRLRAQGLSGAVGLMTSRSVERHHQAERGESGVRARCLATVGLGNAVRVGDPTSHAAARRVGTINLLCWVSRPLAPAAALEALALAAEARTAAILDAGVASRVSGAPATGTGTDCIVIAAPAERRGAAYAGKHTAIGAAIGAAVHDAVRAGARRWQEDQACRG